MPRNPLHDFWVSIQYSLDFIPALALSKDSRLSDPVIERDFRLTPHTAEGFEEKDFHFLAPEELDKLKAAVSGVRAVASKIGARVVATADERKEAMPHFQGIVHILEPDRFMSPEAFEIGKKIEAKMGNDRPAKLDHLRFMTGSDSTGDPAIWIWAYTKEKVSGDYDQEAFFAAVDEIDPILKQAGEAVAPDRWPYISYRSTLDKLEYEAVA